MSLDADMPGRQAGHLDRATPTRGRVGVLFDSAWGGLVSLTHSPVPHGVGSSQAFLEVTTMMGDPTDPTVQTAKVLLRHLDDPDRCDAAAWALLKLGQSVAETPLAELAEGWRDAASSVYSANTEAVRAKAVPLANAAEKAPTRAGRLWAAARLDEVCQRFSAWRAGQDAARRAQIRGWEDLVATVRAELGVVS